MRFVTSTRHRWLRAAAPAAEVLAAILLGWFTWWCWHRGMIAIVRRGVDMSRIEGGWWATATGVATLAGILLLDAGRRVTAAGWSIGPCGAVADPVATPADQARSG